MGSGKHLTTLQLAFQRALGEWLQGLHEGAKERFEYFTVLLDETSLRGHGLYLHVVTHHPPALLHISIMLY